MPCLYVLRFSLYSMKNLERTICEASSSKVSGRNVIHPFLMIWKWTERGLSKFTGCQSRLINEYFQTVKAKKLIEEIMSLLKWHASSIYIGPIFVWGTYYVSAMIQLVLSLA